MSGKEVIIRFGYMKDIRTGLAQEVASELEAWEDWFLQEGSNQSHFEHSAGGEGLGHIGPACAEFEKWMLDTGTSV